MDIVENCPKFTINWDVNYIIFIQYVKGLFEENLDYVEIYYNIQKDLTNYIVLKIGLDIDYTDFYRNSFPEFFIDTYNQFFNFMEILKIFSPRRITNINFSWTLKKEQLKHPYREELFEKYIDQLEFKNRSMYYWYPLLSERFLRKFTITDADFHSVSAFQNDLTENFIRDFADRLDWGMLMSGLQLNEKLLNDYWDMIPNEFYIFLSNYRLSSSFWIKKGFITSRYSDGFI